ncbi:hypothetical protein BKA69DRAFT_663644 [Paraphysoderma sedebokerense]|nr:hypothetical protein BKA69DRAFT_663644 [Paraphysoderma sedebokerense]
MASALILGATGAVGKYVLNEALSSPAYKQVTIIGRREIDYDGEHKEKLVQKTVNFEKLGEQKDQFKGDFDTVFCCLGTTRKDAGSAEAFHKIDHDYVINSANIIHEQSKKDGTSNVHFIYCSSQGANASSMFLYPKTKGLVENDLNAVGFKKLSIFRPGLLERDNPRLVESIALPFAKFLSPKGATVPCSKVAKAMMKCATDMLQGKGTADKIEFIDNKSIHELSDAFSQN